MDPLSAVVQDGRLFGRGSADMKAFIGIALSQAEQFLNSDAPFAVHFAFTYEEEIGCFGVKELIADLRDAGIRPLACIVGEPTSMVPAIAHKGVYRYKCCVRGKEAHSSLTRTLGQRHRNGGPRGGPGARHGRGVRAQRAALCGL
jgi:acetylornithine deacetylase